MFKMGRKFCPRCKSENVEKEMGVLLAVGIPQKWKCKKCGYYGFIFPEKEKIKTNITKNIKESYND